MKDFLSRFEGKPLDKKQIAKAMHLCYINAKDLFDEAKLLKENGRNARAISLAILALEEFGKIPIICDTIIYQADDTNAWRKFWRAFRSHRTKQIVCSTYGNRLLHMIGKGYEVEFPLGIEPMIDKFKQLGFYVSFFEDQFILPKDFADDNSEWLDWLLAVADERIASFEPLHSSLESSERFLNRGIDFLKAMKSAKSPDELKGAIKSYLEMR
jgi:AbiV family abortive infection protein